jgi:hypothetical protein
MPKKALFIPLATISLLSCPRVAPAQQPKLFHEMGVLFTSASSHHPELPSLVGFSVLARWEFADRWRFRLSYHRSRDETRKIGIVCDQYSQRINCRPETVKTRVTFTGLRGVFSRAVRFSQWGEISLGAGASFNHVDPEATGPNGQPADLLVPHTGQLGYLANATLAVSPRRRVPLLLLAGYTGHWVKFRGCSGEDPPQYDPFCGWGRFREVELGLAYTF